MMKGYSATATSCGSSISLTWTSFGITSVGSISESVLQVVFEHLSDKYHQDVEDTKTSVVLSPRHTGII